MLFVLDEYIDEKYIKYILENYSLNERGQVKFKCLSDGKPRAIIGRAGPNHCPQCNSTKCPDYITFKKSIDDEKDKNPESNYDFKFITM